MEVPALEEGPSGTGGAGRPADSPCTAVEKKACSAELKGASKGAEVAGGVAPQGSCSCWASWLA